MKEVIDYKIIKLSQVEFVNCVICNSEKVSSLKKNSREGGALKLFKCKHCGHLWQPSVEYEDLYSSGEFSQIARENYIPSNEKIKQLDQTALSRFFLYKNSLKDMDEILEVGSSIGSFIHLLRIYGKNAYGLEPDNGYCSFSKEQYGFEQNSVMLEDFDAGSKYGGVINFHVIEHVSNPQKFLLKIHDLLDEDGKILIECPSLDMHLSGNMGKFIWKPHIHYFTLSSLYYVISFYFKVINIGFNGDSLYVYAQKNSDITGLSFNKFTFSKLKLVSKFVYLINSIPIIPNLCKTGINHIISNSANFSSISNLIWKKIMFKKYIRSECKTGNKIPISHVSVYTLGNVGDTVLSKCVRDVFNESNKNLKWNLISVWNSVDSSLIDKLNESKMLVIGGGGLFLPDTNKNRISGWQWACSKQSLNKIKVPIIIFAVGYNYFKEQWPEELFIDNLKELVKKSYFFGLRNSGSRKKIIELVGNEFEDKIVFQPCPTTLIRKLYSLPEKRRTRNIAFNVAYDRYKRRFGKDIYLILDQIAIAAKLLSEKKYNIHIVGHVDSDFKFELSIEKHSVPYESISLNGDFPGKVLDFYNNMDVVIGMRGHAQMIPFGLNCGIITLGSHDKMKWFLEDIDALDFYIDINKDPELLSEKIMCKFESLYEDDFNNTIEKIKAEQERLYEITLNNLSNIKVESLS